MTKRPKRKKKPRLGKLSPKYTFFLNPYPDRRFTRCPQCEAKTKLRKRPFLIHIDPRILMNFNLTTPYCPACDLIIMHQDVLEHYLVQAAERNNRPEIIGNDYLVIGTVERQVFSRNFEQSQMTMEETFANLHDFKQVVQFEVIPPHWGPADTEDKEDDNP